MTAQNVASLMYDIKEKITDKEFKDIMDALGVVHKRVDRDLYLFKYYKMKIDIGRFHDGVMGNRLKYRYKEKIVVLHERIKEDGCINRLMNNIKQGIDYEFVIRKDEGEYPVLNTASKTVELLEKIESYDPNEDEGENGIFLEYNEIIPISIEKL